MPFNYQRKGRRSHLHQTKRLNRPHRLEKQPLILADLAPTILNEAVRNKPLKYIKYFDYPLPELLADHSTDPMQNTMRQYAHASSSLENHSSEGRFANHQMIIRRHGETTIFRPKQDSVLANGFTPVIRPSSLLPSYQSLVSSPPISSSISIMNKMLIVKPEQKSTVKRHRKNRHRRKRLNKNESRQPSQLLHDHFANDIDERHSSESSLIHLVQQALHDIIDERTFHPTHMSPQPVPLMSIFPQYPHPLPDQPHNHSIVPLFNANCFDRKTIPSTCFDEHRSPPLPALMSNVNCNEFFYDFPREKYGHCLQENHRPAEGYVRSPIFHQNNYHHASGYFF